MKHEGGGLLYEYAGQVDSLNENPKNIVMLVLLLLSVVPSDVLWFCCT